MRMIDADALIPMMKYATTDSEIGIFPIKIGFDAIVKIINEQPTIEPELKKGKWVRYDGDRLKTMCKCSECGAMIDINEKYRNFFCYHCGARMEENNESD